MIWVAIYAAGVLILLAFEVAYKVAKGAADDGKLLGSALFLAVTWPLSFPICVAFGLGAGIGKVMRRKGSPSDRATEDTNG